MIVRKILSPNRLPFNGSQCSMGQMFIDTVFKLDSVFKLDLAKLSAIDDKPKADNVPAAQQFLGHGDLSSKVCSRISHNERAIEDTHCQDTE